MKAKSNFIFFILLSLCLAGTSLQAQAPTLLNYQGKLADKNGNVIRGPVSISMTFSIYSVGTGGASLWAESLQNVIVTDGVFNVLLGSDKPFGTLFTTAGDRYLAIKVGNDPEMTPRFRLVSAAYAMRTASAARADTAQVAIAALSGTPPNNSVNSAAIVNGSIQTEDLADKAVTSAKIQDGQIEDAEVSATAAIKGTKINPNFGSQNIITTGSVGIGTTSPRSQLHVFGQITTGGTLASPSAGAITFLPPDGFGFFHLDNGPAGGRLVGRLRLSVGSNPGDSEIMSILQNGNVGIGTTNPATTLEVKGKVSADSYSASVNLGSAATPNTGGVYADNVIYAWAHVSSNGTLVSGFGCTVSRSATGTYVINYRQAFTNNAPMATAYETTAPQIAVISARSTTSCTVKIWKFSAGSFSLQDGDFYFHLTGRP